MTDYLFNKKIIANKLTKVFIYNKMKILIKLLGLS